EFLPDAVVMQYVIDELCPPPKGSSRNFLVAAIVDEPCATRVTEEGLEQQGNRAFITPRKRVDVLRFLLPHDGSPFGAQLIWRRGGRLRLHSAPVCIHEPPDERTVDWLANCRC